MKTIDFIGLQVFLAVATVVCLARTGGCFEAFLDDPRRKPDSIAIPGRVRGCSLSKQ